MAGEMEVLALGSNKHGGDGILGNLPISRYS